MITYKEIDNVCSLTDVQLKYEPKQLEHRIPRITGDPLALSVVYMSGAHLNFD